MVKGCGPLKKGLPVLVSRTVRFKRLGRCNLVADTGEGSHNRKSRFTIIEKIVINKTECDPVVSKNA